MLRKLLYQLLKPKSKEEAVHIRKRLSLIYAIVGWNAFGLMFYTCIKNKTPEDSDERRMSYGLLNGIPSNVHVYQVSGLSLTNDFDVAYKAKVAQIEREKE
ncbi:uncharacterized protein LOC105840956 [Monomorium pharaonis]|uniref:uncharacterized protein LOC105840956 n=1 Tax=Monomorium pharaonis TaxID=307658 RepID=UPI0017478669|nr:uncharacterized protein LOC105840956 [Monomorium pharaonis]